MDTARFDYHLPSELVAQFPALERAASRLLVAPARRGAAAEVIKFADLGRLLSAGDVLVVNDTRVLPARLAARKPSGGRVEIMLERVLGGADSPAALVQLRANKPLGAGQKLLVGEAELTVAERRGDLFVVRCDDGGGKNDGALALFQAHGETPLPPYIRRAGGAGADDAARYQTVYARRPGAVAAPTAGLHFDRALIDRLTAAGVQWATVTLHVGAGTFQPVRGALAAHRMRAEWVEVGAGACDAINRARARGARVIAVGTTVVRALESAAGQGGGAESGAESGVEATSESGAKSGAESAPKPLAPFCGDTDLFIRPGHRFRVVDALITNFHLPKSTLLVLVCAFAGYAKIMRAYRQAVAQKLRFYSYGDAMFVERKRRRPA